MGSLLRNVSFLLMGNKHFTKGGYERAAAKFDNSCMQNSLAGRVVLVTGANAGLGFETSKALAARGATLYMLCRNQQRGQEAADKVKQASGNSNVHLAVCDVSSLESVAAFAADWLAAARPLHLLVNNAGVLLSERSTTPEGFNSSFATNVLGTTALTQRLLPALVAGAPSRVVFVSSGGMYTQPLDLTDMQHARLQPWDGSAAYAKEKRCQVALSEHLAEAWADRGVAVYSMHPGWSDTEGVRTSIPGFHKAFQAKLRDPAQGADTIVWLALEDSTTLQPGAFYLDRQPQAKHLTLGGTKYSKQEAAELYDKVLALAGLKQQGAAAAQEASAAEPPVAAEGS